MVIKSRNARMIQGAVAVAAIAVLVGYLYGRSRDCGPTMHDAGCGLRIFEGTVEGIGCGLLILLAAGVYVFFRRD